MGEAREVMDRLTDAALKGDSEALKALYAQDAVAETPDQGTITGRRPDRRLPGRVRRGVSGCRVGAAVQARGRRHGDRRGILRWDEHRLNDGAERRDHSRDGQACAPSRVRRRDGRERGCHEPPVLLRRAGLAHAARSRARVPGVALRGHTSRDRREYLPSWDARSGFRGDAHAGSTYSLPCSLPITLRYVVCRCIARWCALRFSNGVAFVNAQLFQQRPLQAALRGVCGGQPAPRRRR